MRKIELIASGITKNFVSKKPIFKDVNFNITNGQIIGITGYNGAGKSTLVKILAGLLRQSKGNLTYKIDDTEIKKENFYQYYSFVAPYLNLYEEFSPIEHLKIFSKIRGLSFNETEINDWLKDFKLLPHKNKPIREFSSGMKQRMKFMLALQNKSELLFLDEPTSNLDNDGFLVIKDIILKHRDQNGASIIATNDDREKSLCDSILDLNEFN